MREFFECDAGQVGIGRDFDTGTRGVGSRKMCSVGEENLLCLRHQRYWQEGVFVHEFSHSMMQYLDEDDLRNLEAAYQNAVDRELYPKEIYMVSTSGEYWAEGVQGWLGVTLRTDANGGFNTQQKIRDHETTSRRTGKGLRLPPTPTLARLRLLTASPTSL